LDRETLDVLRQHAKQLKDLESGFGNLMRMQRTGMWVTMGAYPSVSWNAITANGDTFAVTLPPNRALAAVAYTFVVSTTHDASNYWTIDVKTAARTLTSAETYDGQGPGTIEHATLTTSLPVADLDVTTDCYIKITATKGGTPGNLTLYPVLLYFL